MTCISVQVLFAFSFLTSHNIPDLKRAFCLSFMTHLAIHPLILRCFRFRPYEEIELFVRVR